MRTTIDGAGRLVVPKSLREAMGLRAGAELEISYAAGRLEIEYAPVATRLEMRDGFPVLVPVAEVPPLTDEHLRETLESIRDRRA